MKTIAKKGETVIIINKGRSSMTSFTLNKPYTLTKDLNEINGFIVEEDDCGYINNGYSCAFALGMKFKKVE